MNTIDLYTEENFDDYLKYHGDSKNSLVANALKEDFTKLVSNFNTESIAISLCSKKLMCTVNEKEYENSPMCSPYNLFCLYPKKRLMNMKNKWLRILVSFCTTLFQIPFKITKFNQVIQVNNKPCDAIVYPDLSGEEINLCIHKLTKRFPNHAILFPRIDRPTHPELFDTLKSKGFLFIPTRPVHIYHPDQPYMKKSHTKRDFSFLRKHPYQLVEHDEITEKDLIRIHQLYQMLFIEKHTKENPNLTLQFFKESHKNHWYHFFGFRNPDGVIDTFMCYEIDGMKMACGPLGYDTTKDKKLGLYRLVFAYSLSIANKCGYVFNFGGGNEEFKSNRGSIRDVGFTAVWCKHLPLYRQFPWWFLDEMGKRVTLKIFKKSTF